MVRVIDEHTHLEAERAKLRGVKKVKKD